MANVNPIFDNSELSLAAYATLRQGSTNLQTNELKAGGMSEYQAQIFVDRWPDVIDQYTDSNSGLSVTVFRNGGEVCVAIRGTETTDFNDLWADLQLGTGEVVDQYAALKTYFDSLKTSGAITATDSVIVAGHSLGGFLAQILTVDRAGGITGTYTYNAPGIGGISLDVFGSTGSVPVSEITNVQGDGFSAIANVGISVGVNKEVQIENDSIFTPGDHSITKLTDSLAAYNTLWQLDHSLSVEKFNDLFKQSANHEDSSLEGIIKTVWSAIGLGDLSLSTDDRENFYHGISMINDDSTYAALYGHITVDTTIGSARTDFGSFLSLYNLTPFVLHCNDAVATTALEAANSSLASQWEADKALPDEQRTFTDQHLQDRSNYLNYIIQRNINDDTSATSADNTEYSDVNHSGDSVVSMYTDKRFIKFGGNGADTLSGGNKNDHLYGGTGIDTLTGGKGDDYLEGGAGLDIYQFDTTAGSFGNDTIVDKDGGTIKVNGATLTATRIDKISGSNRDGTYFFLDANGKQIAGKEGWSITVNGTVATITAKDASNHVSTITVNDFNKTTNNFGITLNNAQDAPAPPATAATIGTGVTSIDWGIFAPMMGDTATVLPTRNLMGHFNYDQASWTSGGNSSMWVAVINALGLDPWSASSEEYRALFNEAAAPYNEWVDKVNSYQHNSITFDASKYQYADGQADSFDGSTADDVLIGQAIEVVVNTNTGATSPLLGNYSGGNGNDVIFGDKNDVADESYGYYDYLAGGRGSDTLYGQGGDDTLYAWQTYNTYPDQSFFGYPETPLPEYPSVLDMLKAGTTTIEDTGEHNILNGGDGNDRLYGASYNDILLGGKGNDFILAGAGQDTISGGNNDDVIYGDSYLKKYDYYSHHPVADFISPDAVQTNNDRAYFYQTGHDLSTLLDKNIDYNDVIDGGDGNDTIFGEIGNDSINGGKDDDILFGDRPYNSGWFTGLATGEFQKLTSTFHGNDIVDGGSGNDKIIGGGGADTLFGGDGNDTIYGDLGIGVYDKAAAGETLVSVSDQQWWGNDTIVGGKGNDLMMGEGGNDTYIVGYGDGIDTINDTQGNNTLQLSSSSIEVVHYGSNVNIYSSGDRSNYITMSQSSFSTFKKLQDSSDSALAVSESLTAQGGMLEASSTASSVTVHNSAAGTALRLGQTQQELSTHQASVNITGTAADMSLTKSNGDVVTLHIDNWNNLGSVYYAQTGQLGFILDESAAQSGVITGRRGDDLIDTGLTTSMTAVGAAGNDTYIVKDFRTTVIENDSEGIDTVMSYGTFTLGDNIENLTMIGTSGYGYGNSLNNIITGSEYNDSLWGLVGDDTLFGNGGSDSLTGGAGNDVIYGGAGVDILVGGAGNDVLDGGAGADIMTGGNASNNDSGNDTFFVDNTGDVVNELMGGGTDLVNSSISYILGDNVENLALMGSADITGTGNALDNVISGNVGANILKGGGGNDILFGGGGSDTYQFSVGDDADIINNGDVNAIVSDIDVLEITGITDYRDLWLHQDNNDLIVSIMGGSDQVTVKDWFRADDSTRDENELDVIRITNGTDTWTLVNDQASVNTDPSQCSVVDAFDRLIHAMATFETNNGGVPTIAPSILDDGYSSNAYSSWIATPAG